MSARPRISIFNSSPEATISSWVPSWASRARYSALPTSGSGHDGFAGRAGPSKRRLLQAGAGTLFVLTLVAVGSMRSSALPDIPDYLTEEDGVQLADADRIAEPDTQWGRTEQQGWTESLLPGLADLGDMAEGRYRFSFSADDAGTETYYRQLHDFASHLDPSISAPMLYSLNQHLPPSHRDLLPEVERPRMGPPSMISYKTIHQTDKTKNINDMTREWVHMNEADGWELNFLDDNEAWEWVQSVFPGTDIEWAWSYMHRGVLRADFLRYLLPLVEGGVYSDADTRPIRPIEQWGKLDVEYLDLSDTDGPDWRRTLATNPAVIVSIDVNVHALMDWWQQWPRALGICQWTLSSAPNHPIMLDAVRRVVNSTRVVERWDMDRAAEIWRLEAEHPEGWAGRISELQSKKKSEAMNVMEWTGPGLFSDAVLGFLLARYRVTWHRLRALDHPLRVGDVLILPITGFSPGGQPDFGAEGPDSPQANVLHNFRGSWKGDGQR